MRSTRTTLSIDDDALLIARRLAARENLSLGQAVSELVRVGASMHAAQPVRQAALRGRFALLPARDETITVEHIRELMEREGI